MTTCTQISSWLGITLGIFVLLLGSYFVVYTIKKNITKSLKIFYGIISVIVLLVLMFFILATSCPTIKSPELVYDFQTEIETVREAEDAFASYLRVYSPESLPPFLDCNQCKRNCTDKGYEGCSCRCSSYIEEFDTMYRIYGNYGPGTFTLYKNGKLYRQPIVGMI